MERFVAGRYKRAEFRVDVAWLRRQRSSDDIFKSTTSSKGKRIVSLVVGIVAVHVWSYDAEEISV